MIEFITVFAISYVLHACGITIGYHRLLSHRSFACPKWVEYFWVALGYLAFEGSPIWWATIHRAHHRHVDTPLDPHSPRFGFKNSWYGWLLHDDYAPHIDPHTQAKDLINDPIYRFLEQGGHWWRAHILGFAICWGFRGLIWAYFGWVPALASLLAGHAVLQIPLMLNVACHIPKLGYKNFDCEDDSVNVWWVGLLAMGEGWHNNHHVFPGSARSGLRAHELDISWWIICAMRKLGWVSRVNAPEEKMFARMISNRAPKAPVSSELVPAPSELVTAAAELVTAAARTVRTPSIAAATQGVSQSSGHRALADLVKR